MDYMNGIPVPVSDDEKERRKVLGRRAAAELRSRPLTTEEVLAKIIPQTINAVEVDDNTALRMVGFYPEWSAGASYAVGFKVQRNGKLWKVVQAHTSQVTWEPENAASLWTQICETHDGTEDDPIPYEGNMVLEHGKYYSQNDVVYVCTRDTVNPVYNPLSELVGLYVVVEDDYTPGASDDASGPNEDSCGNSEPAEETIPTWIQPNSTNPYQIGDVVTHNGKTWECTCANNVWEPGVYGWKEI